MRQFLIITWWEFVRHFKSRSFLLSTFISPLIFALIVFLPTLYLEDSSADQIRLVGCVSFDSTQICRDIQQRFNEISIASSSVPVIDLVLVRTDTSQLMKQRFTGLKILKTELDSLDDAYNTVRERRKYIFQKPKTATRDAQLKTTYEELIQTREARDLAGLEYQRAKNQTDSLWRLAIVQHADGLLNSLQLEGYLLINPEDFKQGLVEFHSLLPSHFLDIEPLKQAVQVVIVEERLKQENLRVDKIQEWLSPVSFREIQLQGADKEEFDFLINYLGPVIVVLFLFISIFTSSGFLFSGVLKEKTNRVIEMLLSTVSHNQLIAGKVVGLGFLGLFQIIIWYGLTLIFIGGDILNANEISFLTVENAILFLVYFVLGYMYFASIFVGIGSLFSNEEDAHHLSQFMRLLSILPILLAILVLETPNSPLVRILSFIPPLTPTFMILRTPLGSPPPMDYYLSSGILLVSTLISIYFAGKLFRFGSLLYGKKPGFKEILGIIRSRK